MKTKYKAPPISELVIGVYFDRYLPLRSEHVGLFWSAVRDEFPTIRQQQLVARPPFGPIASSFTFEFLGENEVFPMPRFWLEAPDGTWLMQIQKNAFLTNWRKRDADYPHFERVKKAFDKNFGRFSQFLNKELGVTAAPQISELAYINIIESCNYWRGPEDTGNVFPNLKLPISENGSKPYSDFNFVTVEQFGHDLALTTTIRSGRTAIEAGKPALVFEFRAIGLLGAAMMPEADEWFVRAHETIVNRFTAITNPDIQQRCWLAE
jgi:uncharacterized protein (TIGR04255 family)